MAPMCCAGNARGWRRRQPVSERDANLKFVIYFINLRCGKTHGDRPPTFANSRDCSLAVRAQMEVEAPPPRPSHAR